MSISEGGFQSKINPLLGRPELYKPEYCEQVKEFMGTGHSLTAFAGEIDVARDTLYDWAARHPEFLYATKAAKAKRVKALERQMFDAETGPQVTSRIFALKGAAPDEYAERIQAEVSGPNGGPIETSDNSGMAELGRRVAFALAAAVTASEEARTIEGTVNAQQNDSASPSGKQLSSKSNGTKG